MTDDGDQYGFRSELAKLSPSELIVLMLLGCAALGAVGVAAVTGWARLGLWLLSRHVLVSPAVVVLPDLPGMGFDVPRCFIAAGLAGLFLTLAVTRVQANVRRRRSMRSR